MTNLKALTQEINNFPSKVLSQDLINTFFDEEIINEKKQAKKIIRDSKKSH